MTDVRMGAQGGILDLWIFLQGLKRWWWIVVVTTILALLVSALAMRDVPYETSFRATVVIPGDTEDTGSAERPELMVLDDLGPLIESQAFAQMVLDAVPEANRESLTVDEVQKTMSGSRYSRVATVTVKSSDAEYAARIADAASTVLPDAVNQYLVAPGAGSASVQTIDPPLAANRDWQNYAVVVTAAGFGGLAIGIGVVAILLLLQPRRDAWLSSDAKYGSR